jgi:uncharacterized protein (DUF1800 family)
MLQVTRSISTSARRAMAATMLAALVAIDTPAAQGPGGAVPNDQRSIAHALNRLSFGPRPGDIARVEKISLAAWIDQQLQPARLADAALAARLSRLETLGLDPGTIAEQFVRPARLERRRRQQQGARPPDERGPRQPDPRMEPASQAPAPGPAPDLVRRERQVIADLAEAKLLRAVYSERQLEEVLVDFWFNHFNVFARKGPVAVYLGEYERDGIRPHVLGRFRDLLGATAKSPAMLFYLDNWMSVDPGAAEHLSRVGRPRRPQALPAEAPPANRRPRGLNENYARELLELHTLGVDGGYTQRDVVEVARAFTGWSIDRPNTGGFRFVAPLHDRGAKTVLGRTIAAGGGIEDGERVLDMLARHPATARHIAFKLAQRFVSDTPPPALVARAASVFQSTDGDLRQVVRAIILSPEFFAADAYRAKVKTPLEFVASALRATGTEVGSALSLVRALADLGMPLYLCQPPTGYDEAAERWVSSGALVARMNFALALAGGRMRGVRLPAESAGPGTAPETSVRDALGGDLSSATRDTMARARSSEQAIALLLGSPEFQRQ